MNEKETTDINEVESFDYDKADAESRGIDVVDEAPTPSEAFDRDWSDNQNDEKFGEKEPNEVVQENTSSNEAPTVTPEIKEATDYSWITAQIPSAATPIQNVEEDYDLMKKGMSISKSLEDFAKQNAANSTARKANVDVFGMGSLDMMTEVPDSYTDEMMDAQFGAGNWAWAEEAKKPERSDASIKAKEFIKDIQMVQYPGMSWSYPAAPTPTEEQLSKAAQTEFNKDYYETAKVLSTPEVTIENNPMWGLFTGDAAPMDKARDAYKELEKQANSSNASSRKVEQAIKDYTDAMNEYAAAIAYLDTWNEDGTMKVTENIKTGNDLLDASWNKGIGSATYRVDPHTTITITNRNLITKGYTEPKGKMQYYEVVKDGKTIVKGTLNTTPDGKNHAVHGDKVDKIDEVLSNAEKAPTVETYVSLANDFVRGKITAEEFEKSRDALVESDREKAYAEQRGREKASKEKNAEEALAEANKKADEGNLSSEEVIALYSVGAISSEQADELYDKIDKSRDDARKEEAARMLDKADELLKDKDKSNDLEALNLIDKADKTSPVISFAHNPSVNKVDNVKEVNKEAIEDVKRAFGLGEFASEFASKSGGNDEQKPTNQIKDEEQKKSVAQILAKMGIPVVSSIASFFTNLFSTDWDERNTETGNEYVDITNRLKENLKEGNFFQDIASVLKAAREYRQATQRSKMYETLKGAQKAVAETLLTGLGFATGTAPAVLTALMGKNVIKNTINAIKNDDTTGDANEAISALDQFNESDFTEAQKEKYDAPTMQKAWDKNSVNQDYAGYNKGLESEAKARKEIPSDFILKVYKKEPRTFKYIIR